VSLAAYTAQKVHAHKLVGAFMHDYKTPKKEKKIVREKETRKQRKGWDKI
jgi:hypothetical protein